MKISHRGHLFCIDGGPDAVKQAETVLHALYRDTATDPALSTEKVHLAISQIPYDENAGESDIQDVVIRVRKTIIQGKNPNQRSYLRNIMTHDLTFCIGPAGTGKTYLAVACAVQALANNEVDRILLVRPAVEAGERLLEDHRDVVAADPLHLGFAQGPEVDHRAIGHLEVDPAAGDPGTGAEFDESHDRQGRDGFAGSGFADDCRVSPASMAKPTESLPL